MIAKKGFLGGFILLLSLTFVVAVVPGSSLAEKPVQLKAAGCKTEHFMLKDLVSVYKNKTGNTIRLGRTGNKKAVTLLLNDKVDFAFTCKPITALSSKFKLDSAQVANWESVPIGKDPILVISNYTNGIDNLSIGDLTRVFKGEIKNWKELGGNDVPVNIGYLSDDVESGIVMLFREFTVGKKGQFDPNGTRLDDPSKLGQFVYATPGGISFVALNSYHGDHSNVLKINGVEPKRENILNDKYKLSATYYLTAPLSKNALVADFIAFSQSKDGQSVVSKNFIPYTQVVSTR